ncbi:hypothetical protein [Actinoallomurus sp. NPDC050550]
MTVQPSKSPAGRMIVDVHGSLVGDAGRSPEDYEARVKRTLVVAVLR